MISWVAMNRIVEREIASDAKLRKRAGGRPLRSHATVLTDGELLARLRTLGHDLDRSSLERLCDQALSAEEIAVCEERLRRFGPDEHLMSENRRRVLAESYFELGAVDKSEALYREWLRADSQSLP